MSSGLSQAGGALALPVFGRSVNPISTRGAHYPHIVLCALPDFQTLRLPCVFSRAIQNWLWRFSFFLPSFFKEILKKDYQRYIMQFFSADALQCFWNEFENKFPHENMKKPAYLGLLTINPKFYFQYCQPARNQPKSHILNHNNGYLRNFYILTLVQALHPVLHDLCFLFYQAKSWIYFMRPPKPRCNIKVLLPSVFHVMK